MSYQKFRLNAIEGLTDDTFFDSYEDMMTYYSRLLCQNEERYQRDDISYVRELPAYPHFTHLVDEDALDTYEMLSRDNHYRESLRKMSNLPSDIDVDTLPNDSVRGLLLDLLIKQSREAIRQPESIENNSFPSGHWYMCTMTNKPNDSVSVCMERYKKGLSYFQQQKIQVYLASLEKSNIYHIHFAIRSRAYLKNEGRDLSKLCGVIVKFERRVNSLKKFNGLMKYVTKRDYEDAKSSTCVELLIDKAHYVEGKGYILDAILDTEFNQSLVD